jgi:uncharacterized lipoprotein YmbA
VRLIHILFIALTCTACSTSPVPDYYLLTANVQPAGSFDSDLIIGIGPVAVADFLDRPEVVTHGGSNALEVDDLHRWAEPLERGVSRVVVLNLAGLLGTQNVSVFPWRRDEKPDVGIRLFVITLDHRAGLAVLGVRWLVVDVASDTVVSQRLSRYDKPSAAEPAALVAAYSDLFAELAAEIADVVRTSNQPVPET